MPPRRPLVPVRSGRQIGIGWRPELAADLLARPDAVDFVEVTAEGCTTPGTMREACAVAEAWPAVVHGVKTSLGGAGGIDRDRAKKLAEVARAVRASHISEHVAFVSAGGIDIGHLTSVPFTREAVRVVARNVAELRRLLPDVPLLLENVAWSFRWPDDAMDEGDFHAEIAEETGLDLLLDVGNLYANAVNAGRDPAELLSRYPLDRVGMIHAAGGVLEGGFYFDTHAHAIPEAVLDLLARVLAITGDVPLVLERDAAFPPFAETRDELSRLAAALPSSRASKRPARVPPRRPIDGASRATPEAHTALAGAQRAMALLLTGADVPTDPTLCRARRILQKKRADDALPLLPRMAAHGETTVALALRCIEAAPRPQSMVAVHDALTIAAAAEGDGSLREAARLDALLLRARFVVRGAIVERRVAPFVEREHASDGVRWVVKGLGANARVRVIERRGAS